LRRGGTVLGLCGGYQMLGRAIHDPQGIEGPARTAEGLGLLDVETTLADDKRLEQVEGTSFDDAPLSGYEMHMGVTEGPDCARPFACVAGGASEGAMSRDGSVIGTYLHGLFADDRQRAAWLVRLGAVSAIAYDALIDETLDELAAHLEAHVDIDRLLRLAR
jgi:adenosylcobyric acid synthase